MDQFIDLCILCGCDYSGKITNIGPVKAYKYIQDHGSIEGVLSHIACDEKLSLKHTVQPSFNHLGAGSLFKHPATKRLTVSDLQKGEFD